MKTRRSASTWSVVGGVAAAGAILCGVAVLSGPTKTTPAKTAAHVAASVPASAPVTAIPVQTQAPSCSDQLTAWRSGAVSDQLTSLTSDSQDVQSGSLAVANDLSIGIDPSADESMLNDAFSSMGVDADALQGNLPPDCVPHASGDLSTGLTDFGMASQSGQQAMSDMSAGNISAAASELKAATAEMNSGSSMVRKATADLEAYSP